MKKVYTVRGFQVATVAQARTVLLVLMLKRDLVGSEEAHKALKAIEGAAK
jgi:hypothetical protein